MAYDEMRRHLSKKIRRASALPDHEFAIDRMGQLRKRLADRLKGMHEAFALLQEENVIKPEQIEEFQLRRRVADRLEGMHEAFDVLEGQEIQRPVWLNELLQQSTSLWFGPDVGEENNG